MKLGPFVLVVLGWMGSAEAEPIDAAIQRANAAKKSLVVELGAEWCGPCKVFENNVLPDPRVQEALKDVVFVSYDIDQKDGAEAKKRFSVDGVPAFIVLGGGVERARHTGMANGEDGVLQFLELVKQAKLAFDDEASIFAKLKQRRGDLTFELEAADWYRLRKLPREALAHYEAVAKHPKATAEQRHAATSAAMQLRHALEWRAKLIADKVALLRDVPQLADRDDLLIATVDSTLSVSEARALIGTVLVAVDPTDASRINSLIYVALAAGANDEALAAAKALTTRYRQAQYLDTLAEVHHARGEREAALKIEDEAIAMEPTLRELHQNRARFASTRRDAPSVVAARAQAAALRGRFDTVDELGPAPAMKPDTKPTPKVNALTERYNAQKALEKLVVERCRTAAGTAREVHARVYLNKDSQIIDLTLYTELNPKPELRPCVVRELMGKVLPSLKPNRETSPLFRFEFTPPPSHGMY